MAGFHASRFSARAWLSPWQVGGENPPRFRPAPGRKTGFTILELLVVVSLMGVLLGIALPRMPRSPYALWNMDRQLLADLRHVRAEALTKGDHFRLRVTTANAYEMARMRFVGGAWVADQPYRSRVLPDGVSFTTGVGSVFEFNTRGLLIDPAVTTRLALTDSHTDNTRHVTVWPSGQVAPL